MNLKLKDYTVELKDEMTWGDAQRIEEVMLSSAKMKGSQSGEMGFDFDGASLSKTKYVTIELMIKSIKKGEEEIPYTKEWVDNLSLSDGNKLYEQIELLTKKK